MTLANTGLVWSLPQQCLLGTIVVVVREVGEHGSVGLVTGGPDLGTDLGFKAGEERLGRSVVEA